MSMSPWKPGGLPAAEEQALRSGVSTGVPAHARMQRVKVYSLTDDRKWDDQGTGHVTIDYIEGSRELALTVVDEVDNDTLLLHNITSDDIYRKQEGTIISWKDPEKALELALSFQEAAGCSYIWENMHHIQQNLQINVLHPQVGSHSAFESREASRDSIPHDESLVSVHGELKDLPPLELSSLPLMLKIVLEHGRADQMRVAELIYRDHEFFPKLVTLFRMCEDLENMDNLHMIFRLVKGIILLNNSAIFEKVFSDAFILDIIGALEYDPEVHKVQKHRKILQEHVVFKEAIPIKNAYVASKIHQTYRIGYIKDFIFPRGALDDATLASLNSIIQANSAIVSQLLKDDASFIHELITRMKSSNISAESKSNLMLFLHEFCTLSKSLQPAQRLQLSRDFVSEGVLDIISDVLQSHDKSLISTGTSILMHFINQDRSLVVSYMAHQDETCQEGNSLLETLIQGMATDSGGEMHCQYYEILRILMDSSPAYMATDHKDVAIQIFCEKHLHKLIDVIASSCPKGVTQSTPGSVGVATMVKPEILLNSCELLCFCVLHHPDRIKLSFYTSNLLEKILALTRRREKNLVVAAVRFMRTVIGRKDGFLIDRIIKFNLLKPVIEVFVENGDRDNMLHSGVLELLEYTRKENIDSLVEYVYNSFWGQLVNFEHLKSIRDFKLKYQQIMESAKTKPSTNLIDMKKKADERGVDKQEDFNKDRPKLAGLVDYDDDEKDVNSPPITAVSSDEDDQVLHIPMVRRSSMDGKNTDVKANKKAKLEVGISCAKNVPTVNVTDKPSDLEDNTKAPLSPPICTESSEDDEDIGDGSPGSQIEQRAAQSLDSVHQTGMDFTEAAKNSSPKTD